MYTYNKKAETAAAKVKSADDEQHYIRELAGMCVEIGREPRMKKILQRWRDVNSGRLPDRAPIWCKPVGCWQELMSPESLVCKDKFHRDMEYYFRKILIKREIDDDEPVYDYYKVSASFDVTPNPPFGFEFKRHAIDGSGSAWGYDSALQTNEDFDRLTVPKYKYNHTKSLADLEKFQNLLNGIMEVKLTPINGYFSIATLCQPAAALRGLEQMMVDMALEPHLMHHLMQVITEGAINQLDAIEESGVLIPNTDEPMFLSDPLRTEPANGKYTLKDCWGAGNSQEFDPVAPEMTKEFLIDYQNRIFERFGAVAYGCCENLTKKIDQVLSVPNLKIFVCSAWSDLETIVKRVGKTHCIMWRQSASDVTCLKTLDKVRQDTEHGAELLKGCRYQVVLRELQTLSGHKTRLHEWTRMCKEIVGI